MKIEELLYPSGRHKRNLKGYSTCEHCGRTIRLGKDEEGNWFSIDTDGELHKLPCVPLDDFDQ